MYDPNTAPPSPAASPPAQRRQWGALSITLLVIGLLIVIPSGLCTGIMGVGTIAALFIDPNESGDALSTLLEVLMVGGIPLAIGGILVYAAFQARK